ncbi:unnamed protein product [Mytilus edulis]|uniref:Uncharacterized protein n=1 Tax=Mytilus edulis TaxID=6550 RepID=A0A8S3RK93_MYTED|nr:unnamed protein product [Mytilus edulis]
MLPETSYAQGISCNAHKSMQRVWIRFGDGFKSLYDFNIYLYGPIFDTHKLQKLSDNACTQISLAIEDIMRSEVEIKEEIDRLLYEKENIETDMRNTETKIISMTQTITIKEEEIKRANVDLQSAKRAVNLRKTKRTLLTMTDGIVKTHAADVAVVGGVLTGVIAIASGGIAVPVVATVIYMSMSGVSAVAAGATHRFLKDAKKIFKK